MLSQSKHDCGNGSILLSHFDMLSVTWIEHWVYLFISTISQANALFFRRCFNKPQAGGPPDPSTTISFRLTHAKKKTRLRNKRVLAKRTFIY
jgi:hypothetical protein